MVTLLKYPMRCQSLYTRHKEMLIKILSQSMQEANSSPSLPTFAEYHHKWLQRFKEANIPEPEESAGYLIAHLLSRKTFSLIPKQELQKTMTDKDTNIMNNMCANRLARMPVQYLIGEWDFFGINLKMRPPVFIPRPETEGLTELVQMDMRNKITGFMCSRPLKVLEIGCGSGAITLSLLKSLNSEEVFFTAIDAVKHAVELTEENAKLLGLFDPNKLKIMHLVVKGDEENILSDIGPFDVIVSNPPYIPTHDMGHLPAEISRYEDENALHGGVDGLDIIRDMLKLSKHILAKTG